MSEPTHAFVAYLPCGHAIGMSVDLPDEPHFTETFYRENAGREIRHVTLDEARSTPIYVRDCLTCRSVVAVSSKQRSP